MKKLMICLMTVSLLSIFSPAQSVAAVEATSASTPAMSSADAEKVNVLVKRLNEIDAMDKSNLSASEKKALRKEVRAIKRDVKELGGGVYISVGVLLLIIIILILL
jgi:hypothetical protein